MTTLTHSPSAEIIRQFDVSGPRYTSYPTADRFVEAFGADHHAEALLSRKVGGVSLPLSIYVHIPFCESLCFYCACNKIITKKHDRGDEYLHYLAKEIELHVGLIGKGQRIGQLHLGGGSPTFLSDNQLSELMEMMHQNFSLDVDGEFSIEVDPRTVDGARLRHLAALGFNRISFGVQDFDHEVQKSVHRIQSIEAVFNLVDEARALNFKSVNVDLIYGLPNQTRHTFSRTVSQVVSLIKPDRIALYAYAHLPERFKAQRHINAALIPAGEEKIIMFAQAMQHFVDAGYTYIGMDHFALPGDDLAVAKRQGRLHRNFQGYSTQPDCDLIGMGVSSISRVGSTYSQNVKTLSEYYDALNQGRFPTARGLALSRDDVVRRAVIMALMCQGELQFESIELAFMIDFKSYFSKELDALQSMVRDGLVEIDADGIQVTTLGWFFVRGIAMLFDRYLQTDKNRTKFSKII